MAFRNPRKNRTLREQVSSLSELRAIFTQAVESGIIYSEESEENKRYAAYADMRIEREGPGSMVFFGMGVFEKAFDRDMTRDPFGIKIPLDYVWPQQEKGHRSYIAIELHEKFNAKAFLDGDIKASIRYCVIDGVEQSLDRPLYLDKMVKGYEAFQNDKPRGWWKNPFGPASNKPPRKPLSK